MHVVTIASVPDIRSRIEALAGPRPTWRVVNETADRRGLLATTAAIMAEHGLSIKVAKATTADGLARQELEVTLIDGAPEPNWGVVGVDLRAALLGERARPLPSFKAEGEAAVRVLNDGPQRWVVHISAPDTLGLLAVTAAWFVDHGLNVESAEIGGEFGWAVDTFVVTGDLPAGGERRLTALLSGRETAAGPDRRGSDERR